MRITSNANPYVYEYKKPNETQSRFIDLLAEMKLSSFEGNRLNVRLTPSREPSDDSVARASVFDGKIARWEDCGVYEAPETPELRESPPTYYEQRLSGYYLGLSESAVYTRLEKLAEEAASADYTGMSKVEVFESILNRYEEAFGKDFLDAGRLGIVNGASAYCCIGIELNKELKSEFGSEDDIIAVNRERLYGDMSDDEIQDQIRAKYPKNLTNRDLFLMMSEMGEVGAIPDPSPFLRAYARDYCFDVEPENPTIISDDYWLDSLDKPIKMELIIAQHNAHQISQVPEAHKDAAVLSGFLLKYLDVHLTADGFMAVGASRSELINDITNSNK